MATDEEIRAAGGNDVGQWGDKKLCGYSRPFRLPDGSVDIESLPAFGSDEERAAQAPVRSK